MAKEKGKSRKPLEKSRPIYLFKQPVKKMKNFKQLSKAEMKNTLGGVATGGNCAYYYPHGSGSGGPVVTYNVSKADALAYTDGVQGAHWCCDSCSSASWYGI